MGRIAKSKTARIIISLDKEETQLLDKARKLKGLDRRSFVKMILLTHLREQKND